MTSILAPVLCILLSSLTAAAQADNSVWWLPSIAGGHYTVDPPLTYRLFAPPAALDVDLVVKNESSSVLTLDTASLARAVGISLRRGGPVPASAEWQSGTASRPDTTFTVFMGERLELEPDAWVRWRIVVRPEQPLVLGSYHLDIDMTRVPSTIAAADGSPWRGRMVNRGTLTVVIEPPTGPQEATLRDRIEAGTAVESGRLDDAVAILKRAVADNPADLSAQGDLGSALLKLNRYREAIPALERVMPAAAGARSLVPTLLALAYLGTGDASRAADTLRRSGVPEARIPEEMARLKRALALSGPAR